MAAVAPAAPASAQPSSGPIASADVSATRPATRIWLRLGIGLLAVWWIALITSALFTANPLVISEPQIAQADVVVIAKISDADPDSISIERVLKGKPKQGEAKVRNLHDVNHHEPGSSYILPLTRFGGEFRVTTLPLQESAPLIYIATPETIDRVKSLVR